LDVKAHRELSWDDFLLALAKIGIKLHVKEQELIVSILTNSIKYVEYEPLLRELEDVP